jgi:hypothetical protein
MFLSVLINLISILIFLYILWNKLKEDYSATLIFSSGFTIAITVVIANLLAYRFFPEYWFWMSFIGVIIAVILSVYKYKLAFYEFIDSVVISLHPWLGLIYLDKFASTLNPKILLLVFQVLISAILYLFSEKHYKSFSWYRSGRVGFAGFAVLGIFFILRSAIALTFDDMLSLIGSKDAIISGAVSFIAFLAIFNLSKSKV